MRDCFEEDGIDRRTDEKVSEIYFLNPFLRLSLVWGVNDGDDGDDFVANFENFFDVFGNQILPLVMS